MSTPVFPITKDQDQQYYREMPDDPAIRVETEGGYEITRPRYTRRPRRTYVTGWSYISSAEKATFDAFWDQMRGGAGAFMWKRPTDGQEILVRFTGNKPSVEYAVMLGHDHCYHLKNVEIREV